MALDPIGDVTVVAPDTNQSAVGHQKTLMRPLRVRERTLGDGSLAYSVDGSPTDAVSLAFLGYFGHGFDLVASGINYGANLGDDITYSGTVSAAMEAVINNCPAFAISQEYYEHPDFALAAVAAATVARNILEHGLSPGELVNVNVPAVTIEECEGFEVTRLGKRVYQDQLVERLDPRGIPYFWIGGPPPSGLAVEGTDFHAVINRRIAVTPIHLDLTGRRLLKRLRTWSWPLEPTAKPARLSGVPSPSGARHATARGGRTMDDLTNLMSQLGGATAGAGAADPAAALSGLQARRPAGGRARRPDGQAPGRRAGRPGRLVGRDGPEPADRPRRSSAGALGPETVQKLSARLRASTSRRSCRCSRRSCPQIIDMLTPDGQEPAGGLTGQGMPDLGGLLGRPRPEAPAARPAAASPTSTTCSAVSAACSAATRAADHRRGRRAPGIVTRPCRDATAVGGPRHGPPAMLRAWTSTASLAAARIRRFLEAGAGRVAVHGPTGRDARTSSRSGSGGTARPLLVFSKPDAQKVRNLRANPAVMLGVGDPEDDFDIGLLEGRAELLDRRRPPRSCPPAHLEKYADRMAAIGLTRRRSTPRPTRRSSGSCPDHYLGWHGRTVPQSARVAGAPAVSIDEPPTGRPRLLEWLGEPLSRGLRGSVWARRARRRARRPVVRPRSAGVSRPAARPRRARTRNQTWSSWRRRTSPISRSLVPQSSASSVALIASRTLPITISWAASVRSIIAATSSAPSGGRGIEVSSAA